MSPLKTAYRRGVMPRLSHSLMSSSRASIAARTALSSDASTAANSREGG